jgi:hypothetical protein
MIATCPFLPFITFTAVAAAAIENLTWVQALKASQNVFAKHLFVLLMFQASYGMAEGRD